MTYWYFTYKVTSNDGNFCETDESVIVASGKFFPIANVIDCFEKSLEEESVTEDVKFILLNTTQISEDDFNTIASRYIDDENVYDTHDADSIEVADDE